METREINSYQINQYSENNGGPGKSIAAAVNCYYNGELQGILRFHNGEVPVNRTDPIGGYPILNFRYDCLAEIINTLRNESPLFLGTYEISNVLYGWLSTSDEEPVGEEEG